jgi:hypothetical protein
MPDHVSHLLKRGSLPTNTIPHWEPTVRLGRSKLMDPVHLGSSAMISVERPPTRRCLLKSTRLPDSRRLRDYLATGSLRGIHCTLQIRLHEQ